LVRQNALEAREAFFGQDPKNSNELFITRLEDLLSDWRLFMRESTSGLTRGGRVKFGLAPSRR
jgi:hypothetical protein